MSTVNIWLALSQTALDYLTENYGNNVAILGAW